MGLTEQLGELDGIMGKGLKKITYTKQIQANKNSISPTDHKEFWNCFLVFIVWELFF